MTLWIFSKKSTERALDVIRQLGYGGDSITGVDPDVRGFHSFAGQEVELMCVHENGQDGNVYEGWYLPTTGMANSGNKASIKAKVQEFDRLLANRANGNAADEEAADDFGRGISDVDAPI